jgi:tetrahydromethanopterin S-methyltransferase subunit G
MEQATAFRKLWVDTFGNMASVWSQYSPGSPPTDEMRKMRGGMLKALAGTWDEYMRTPQFMEMMKASLNGALDLRRMARDGINKVHEQFEMPTKEDIDSVLLAIRHVERRVLDRLEGIDDRVRNITGQIEKLEESAGKRESGAGDLAERLDQIDKRIGKIDGGVGKLGERIEALSKGAGRPAAAKGKASTK